MDDDYVGLCAAFVLGLLLGACLIVVWFISPVIENCELTLPRNQHCVLTAVKEGK